MSPALMYSLHLPTAASNSAAGEVRRGAAMRHRPAGVDVRQLQVGHALLQPLDQPIDPAAGRVVTPARDWLAPDSLLTWAWATAAIVLSTWSKMTMRS